MTDYYDVRLKQRRHQMLLQDPQLLRQPRACWRIRRALSGSRRSLTLRSSCISPRRPVCATHSRTLGPTRCQCHRHLQRDGGGAAIEGAASADGVDLIRLWRQRGHALHRDARRLTRSSRSTRQPRRRPRAWAMPMRICGTCPQPCSASSPSMAPGGDRTWPYFKFVDAILDDRPIDIYNHGDMYRDFTYVDDLVRGHSPAH